MKKNSLFNHYWAYLFVLIPILLQVIFFYLPMLQGFFYSLTDWTGLTNNYNFVGLRNFQAILSDQKFMKSIGFTVIFTLGLIVGEVVLGIVIARFLNRKMKGVGFFRTAYFFPAVLSTVTLGLIFKQIFNYGLPQLGEKLGWGFLEQNLIANEKTVFWGVLFVALWQGIAMPVVIFLAGLQSIPEEILEAASIDGATSQQKFIHIEFPYLLPSLSMVFIMALKAGLTAFDLIYALTGGGPSDKTTTLGLLVYNYAFKSNQYGYANAIAVVLFMVIAVISVLQIRLSKRFEV
ncbi:carbohydrate ABC transporter permease [Enterococcus lemanii]|uniref:Carbohydrate ABC transporter permease n=1 Tax=Enterococcus lemanii TaxID=1159752 RepID=A0ABV9MU46_9ENTE|nr:sugar ABC transporter permease [Enterococcus lemanii]MBM7708454.1 raffinose/stachyose/melibiose transport system permease protein [Enterococcus lemanii]NLM65772.1 sugar ABC transporter permease [Enterococcus sp.]